jgi:hypothetical protein
MATIGDTANPSTNTIYYDALLSTKLAAYRKQMVDNIFRESAYLSFMRMSDAVKNQNGGERIAMPLMYGRNTTVGSYEGYEVLDTTPQEGVTTAFYEWREIAGTISISRKEERQNSGEGRLLNLLESKITQAEMTMREVLNEQLLRGTVSGATFVPGNSAKDMYPLGYFLRKLSGTDPTIGGNVGNIAAGSTNEEGNTWWTHRTSAFNNDDDTGNDFSNSVTTYAGLKANLHRMQNFCSRGAGGAPNLVVSDQVTYETYNNALDTQVRYTNTAMADMGFDTIKLRGATMIWDEIVPDVDTGTAALTTGTAFFINTKFYNLIIDSETDIEVTPFVEPENQTAKTAKILFMGNAAVSNMRKHGVAYAISQSITS